MQKKLEETVKKILLENINKPSPLKEVYENSAKRAKQFESVKVTKESILEKYKKLF